MADRPPNRPRDDWFPKIRDEAQRGHRTTSEDLERALDAAEMLLSEGQHESRHLQNLRFGAVSFLIITLLSVGGLALGFIRYEVAALLAIALVVGMPVAVIMLRFAIRPTRAASTIIAAEIAAMVGEVVTEVAAREQWSHLRLEAARLRLSRFPLVARHPLDRGLLAEVEHLFGPDEPT